MMATRRVVLFVWLALGMFGLYNLQVPAWLQERVSRLSSRQKQGTLLGTAIMGALWATTASDTPDEPTGAVPANAVVWAAAAAQYLAGAAAPGEH
mgnify:CR=1 FL=1